MKIYDQKLTLKNKRRYDTLFSLNTDYDEETFIKIKPVQLYAERTISF